MDLIIEYLPFTVFIFIILVFACYFVYLLFVDAPNTFIALIQACLFFEVYFWINRSDRAAHPSAKSMRELMLNRFKDRQMDSEERILSDVRAVYKIPKSGKQKAKARAGILIATNKRIAFLAKNKGEYFQENFPYRDFFMLDKRKGRNVRILASGKKAAFYVVTRRGLDRFIKSVEGRVSGS